MFVRLKISMPVSSSSSLIAPESPGWETNKVFAVKAFVELVKQYGMDEYEFAVYETKTGEVISNVRNFCSEIGVLYENEFNSQALNKILKENNLEFHPLFTCG